MSSSIFLYLRRLPLLLARRHEQGFGTHTYNKKKTQAKHKVYEAASPAIVVLSICILFVFSVICAGKKGKFFHLTTRILRDAACGSLFGSTVPRF